MLTLWGLAKEVEKDECVAIWEARMKMVIECKPYLVLLWGFHTIAPMQMWTPSFCYVDINVDPLRKRTIDFVDPRLVVVENDL